MKKRSATHSTLSKVLQQLQLPQRPQAEHGMVERGDLLDGDLRSRRAMDGRDAVERGERDNMSAQRLVHISGHLARRWGCMGAGRRRERREGRGRCVVTKASELLSPPSLSLSAPAGAHLP